MKIIAIDYDGSYTEFPELFDIIITFCKEKGYRIILVTMRYKHEIDEYLQKVIDKVDDTIFTCRKAKASYLEGLGIHPDLWIDDRPDWIFKNSI